MSRQLDDWLENYMKFTQRSEPPELYHLWSGLTAISSALRRKTYCNWGALRGYIYPNLYICLVGPPGGRKGTAMKIAKSMVHEIEVPMGSDSLGSTQALYQELTKSEDNYIERNGMAKKHKSLSIWSEEFQVFLSERDLDLIGSLTDLFDCADVWKYTSLKQKSIDVSNCWLTIIGAITPSMLQSKLTQDAVGGGLLSRIIFVVGYGPKQKVALPFLSQEEENLKVLLNQDLQQIANLSGPFKMSKGFLRNYARWYENTTQAEGIQNDKFMGYNSRRALHLNKICMLVSASESDSMIIEGHHFDKALAIIEATEEEMPNAFYGLGMASQSNVYAKILSFIEGKENFTWRELVQTFQLDINNPSELRGYMEIAQQSGLVKEEISPTTCNYKVMQKKPTKSETNLLDETVLSKMDKNIIKEKKND